MMCEGTDNVFKPRQNAKLEEGMKSPTNYKTKSGTTQIICIPGYRKHTEVDLHFDTNVLIPHSKGAKFFSCCSFIISILSTLFVILAMRYQTVERHLMEQNIMVLSQKVEFLALTSESIRQNVAVLQDQVNSLILKHQSTVGYMHTDYQNTVRSSAVKDVPSPELKTVKGSNFSILQAVVLDTDGSSEGAMKLGDLIDVKNRSSSSDAENSDYEHMFTVPLRDDTSVDPLAFILNNDTERSDSLQELKLDISDSSLHFMDDLLSAEGSSSGGEDADEGMRQERAKRSNRRGNQKPSGGQRGRSNKKRKKSGTMNLFAFQDG
jgi:hypothetical protein